MDYKGVKNGCGKAITKSRPRDAVDFRQGRKGGKKGERARDRE